MILSMILVITFATEQVEARELDAVRFREYVSKSDTSLLLTSIFFSSSITTTIITKKDTKNKKGDKHKDIKNSSKNNISERTAENYDVGE